jgi:putative ATP-dependent endonuclease of OLD family
MIESLIIRNFRSVKDLEVRLGEINAFIGPHNAGKSNIMRALKLVLGEGYPTVRSFDDEDFYNYDKSNPIRIEVRFDRSLKTNPNVHGFRLEYDGDTCGYSGIDQDGELCRWPGGGEVRVSNRMKDEVFLMYVGLDRQAHQQLRPTKWTTYGKLLNDIEEKIDNAKKGDFRDGVNAAYERSIAPDLKVFEACLKEFVKEQTGLDLCFEAATLGPVEVLKNLRPHLREHDSDEKFDAECVGTGVQSALSVAIARAYAKIVKQPLLLAIEEPELYLHPHACRHFYKLLLGMPSDEVQIVYTTHEGSFVEVTNCQNIHLVRKNPNGTYVRSGSEISFNLNEITKIASKFDRDLNEIFFANHVVLTEGFADKIAAQYALEKLGVNLDKENISIVECGGRDSIKDITKILNHFRIPCYVLIDEDPGDDETRKAIKDLESIIEESNVFLQSPELSGLFGLQSKPNRQEALEIFPRWFQNNDVPEVYTDLRTQIGAGDE